MANLIYLHNQRSRYGFATFGDPGRDLKTNYDCINNQINYSRRGPNFGNINIGTVRFNESRLNSVDSITYSYSANLNVFDNSVRWQTTGNGSLKPLDVTIPGGFPFVNVTKDYSLSLKEDFTLDISGLAGNYDSLVVVLSDFGNEKPNDGSVKKTISDPNSSTVTFASSDMTAALSPSQYGSLRLRAYNYSNKTLENKVYLFELSSHAIVSLTISP